MRRPFREHHLLQILAGYEGQRLPLDLFLRNYFHDHRAIGGNDRRFICEAIYGMIRWRGLLDHCLSGEPSWEARWQAYRDHKWKNPPSQLPLHVQVSFPKKLFSLLSDSLGQQVALSFCQISNEPAPTTLRINPIKTTRKALLALWDGKIDAKECPKSPLGIQISKRVNLFGLPEFKAGLFEVQDEGSQLIADLMAPQPGDWVLDFCAGAGGKTLAFAHKMEGKGQVFLHDVRPHALKQAQERLRRAGIQNGQIVLPDDPKKNSLKGKMDWVLVDLPCSGTGTLRRNPDIKWKLDPDTLSTLIQEQRQIFAQALEYLSPKGTIVYTTCSVLPQENGSQADYFVQTHSLSERSPRLCLLPERGGNDGFFGALFTLFDSKGYHRGS